MDMYSKGMLRLQNICQSTVSDEVKATYETRIADYKQKLKSATESYERMDSRIPDLRDLVIPSSARAVCFSLSASASNKVLHTGSSLGWIFAVFLVA